MAGEKHALAADGPCQERSDVTPLPFRQSDLWAPLLEEELSALSAMSRRKQLAAGQLHVIQGDMARDFGTVISGVGKLVRDAEDGRSQIVGLVFASDFIAGAYAGQGAHRETSTIEAVSPLELCLFPRDRFDRLLTRYPKLESRLLDHAMQELLVTRDWMVLLGRKTAQERVASFILYVAEKMDELNRAEQVGFDLPLGRADIADFIGLTIETVSRQMTKLRRDGVIVMDGPKHVTYIDAHQLRARAGF